MTRSTVSTRSKGRRWPLRVFVALCMFLTACNSLRVLTDSVSDPRLQAVVSAGHRAQLIYLYGPEAAALLASLPPALVLEAMSLLWLSALFPIVETLQVRPEHERSALARYRSSTVRLAVILLSCGAVVHLVAWARLHQGPSGATLALLLAPAWLAPFYVALGWATNRISRGKRWGAPLAAAVTASFVLARASAKTAFWPTAHAASLLCGRHADFGRALLIVLGWALLVIAAGTFTPLVIARVRDLRSRRIPSKLGTEKC
jgi:hypothetical protein